MSIARSTSVPVLVFAAFATLAVAGCGVSVTPTGDAARRVENESVPVDDLRMVHIDTENGSVELRSGGRDEIGVRSILRERHDGDADSTITVDGDRLLIAGECDDRFWNRCSVGFVVTVPSDLDIEVSTENGRIDLTGINGAIDVTTDNGAIEGTALGSAELTAHSDNGRIRLSFDSAPTNVDAESDNGAISVQLPDDAEDREGGYEVDAHSGNGAVDVDVRTDPSSSRHLGVRSDNGTIDIGYRTS